jgi:hypothetical protein
MPTAVYDSSLITKRLRDKAISESFVNRIQNQTTGSAPYLGITEQSIIDAVKVGQMKEYRKNEGGCVVVSEGCPCFVPITILVSGSEQIVSRGWYTHIGEISNGLDIIVDSNNDIYVTGFYSGTPNIYNSDGLIYSDLPTSENIDAFIVKYNSFGFTQWTTRIAGIGNDYSYSISTDSNNNIIVTGYYDSNPVTIYNSDGSSFGTLIRSGLFDAFIVKYNSSGFAQWTTKIAGTSNDYGDSITTDSNNNIIVIGYYNSNPVTIYNSDGSSFGTLIRSGLFDTFIVKYNSSGFAQWTTKIAGTSNDYGRSISTDSNNNIIVTGYYNSNPVTIYNSDGSSFGTLINSGMSDIFIVKYNSFGFTQWTTRIAGTSNDEGRSISTDSNNNIIVTGYYDSNPVTIYNSDGSSFGTLINSGISDICIVKYNSSGFAQWTTKIAGTVDDEGRSISTDSNNNIIVTGYYDSNPVTIYNSDGSSFGTLINSGIGDTFIVKYNSSGFAQWATRISGTVDEVGVEISTDSNNNIIVTGYYESNPVTIYNSDGVTFNTLSREGTSSNTFIVKYNSYGFIIL